MTKGKVYFMGFLANVDSSITSIELDYGFKIEKMHIDKASIFMSLLSSDKHSNIALMKKGCVNDNYVYYISNSFLVEDLLDVFSQEITNFKMEYITNFGGRHTNIGYEDGYLENIIKVMRLFKRGDISNPIDIFYYFNNNVLNLHNGGEKSMYGPGRLFELDDNEINELQNLIQNINYYTFIKKSEIHRALTFFIDYRGYLRCNNLYKVYEIINKDLNIEKESITCLGISNTKIRLFKHTMNHLCGRYSRHAHEHQGEGMDINLADELIRNLLNNWIDWKMERRFREPPPEKP